MMGWQKPLHQHYDAESIDKFRANDKNKHIILAILFALYFFILKIGG